MLLAVLVEQETVTQLSSSLIIHLNSWSNILLAGFVWVMPAMVFYLISQRRNIPCNRLTFLGISFAILLGFNWLAQAWFNFHPQALWVVAVNSITLGVGGVLLWFAVPLMPKFLAMPSTNQMVLVNQVLQREIEERKQAEATLKQLNEELETRVEHRTRELRSTLIQLQAEIGEREEAEVALRQSRRQLLEQNQQLTTTLKELKATQSQLIQSEKLSSLGQMVAGIAHEINNPINFISGNLEHLHSYTQALSEALTSYQHHCPQLPEELLTQLRDLEIEFIEEDLPQLLGSMAMGVKRICEIVRSLRNFSRLDEAEMKVADLHEGIDSTLMILQSRLKSHGQRPEIKVIKNYGQLPTVECYPGQLNQVFMNLLANAIDALEEAQSESPRLEITTRQVGHNISIQIADNGVGIDPQTLQKLFDPFYTTKPVGQGTGLGLAISYQIVVERHNGQLRCQSPAQQGAMFEILIPGQAAPSAPEASLQWSGRSAQTTLAYA
ncbi:MAG: GHKL domain-containing protein [Spirulina sp. SIO3F2]|nr:GHKL domain-containing protein [Spirulina sp. SIO3F2]